ncbi:MAG: zinc-ribbon domain-containing protein [Bacteroidales bacterium]|nr:zinc-ribbon domain-containing protein [Bacteroidales bacterium]
MFVIFGLDDAKPEIWVSKHQKHCNHCHNSTFWQLAKHQTRVSLFFIPIIPVKSRYYFLCPICQHGDEISKDDFNHQINSI